MPKNAGILSHQQGDDNTIVRATFPLGARPVGLSDDHACTIRLTGPRSYNTLAHRGTQGWGTGVGDFKFIPPAEKDAISD
jgi:hypothetical protein